MEGWQNIILQIALPVVTGAASYFFARRKNEAEAKSIDVGSAANTNVEWEKLYREVLSRVKQLEEDNDKCEDKYRILIRQFEDLRVKVIHMEAANNDLPFPMWLKDMSGKMMYVNPEYERAFLEPMGKTAKDYIGKTDYDIWPQDVAANYMSHDRAAQKKGLWVGNENITIDGSDVSADWKVIKYLRYAGKLPLGVSGMAVPLFK